MKLPSMQIILCVIGTMLLSPACTTVQKSGKHLFILSGQSNMTGNVKKGFEQVIQERFGKENVVVVLRMKSGRGIRFWVADYQHPTRLGMTGHRSNGQEYKPLIEASLAAIKDQSFDTVGFIWMQGESDANNRLSEVYEESFIKLTNKLKKDLARDDMYYVVGRISDYARSRVPNVHWHKVRNTQVKLGKTKGNGWINTDDLNGGDAKNPDGDIHYPKEGAVKVGQRFAAKAIELIFNNP
jgi:hypothetical protein